MCSIPFQRAEPPKQQMRMVVGHEKDPATVSLYVCDIPQTISKEELEAIFSKFFGFLEVRLARDKNRYALFVLMRSQVADCVRGLQQRVLCVVCHEQHARPPSAGCDQGDK